MRTGLAGAGAAPPLFFVRRGLKRQLTSMEQPSPARQRLAILAAAVPALLLSAKLFHVLFEPLAGANRQWVVDAVLLMLLEFIMVRQVERAVGG